MTPLPLISHRLYMAALGQPKKEPPGYAQKPQLNNGHTGRAAAGNGANGTRISRPQTERLFTRVLTPEVQS